MATSQGMERRDTVTSMQSQATVANKSAQNVGYEKKASAYEPAPKDNINDNTDDQMKL